MSKNKTILITGGAGFIGVNLVKYILESAGWNIRILDNLSTGSKEILDSVTENFEERVKFIKGDIRSERDVKAAVQGSDFVCHLAAQTGVIPSLKNPFGDAENNILGTLQILEQARKASLQHLILASSSAALGEEDPPFDEKKVPQPIAPYGASKLAGEAYCSAYASSLGMRTTALRFSNVYGPLSKHKESVVSKFTKQVLKNEPLVIFGDGKQTRDYIYVYDICRAIVQSLEKSPEPGKFSLLQLGTGKPTTVNELIGELKGVLKQYGKELPPIEYKKSRSGEIRENYADISKAKEELGFAPLWSLEEGLKETVGWFVD